MYLREHNNIALHIACGDIVDVEIEDDTFVINTNEEYILELLSSEESKKELKKALEYVGFLKYQIRKNEKSLTTEKNIQILKKYFNDIIIK